MQYLKKFLLFSAVVLTPFLSSATEFDTTIPMSTRGVATYYVPGQILGVGKIELMVDTGSGYLTINEEALRSLKQEGRAHYVRDLVGILANGSKIRVPVYQVSAVNIGGSCWLNNVEAAVFPGKTRYILGLSALTKASPFIFSTNPPRLVLSNCSAKLQQPATTRASAQVGPDPAPGEQASKARTWFAATHAQPVQASR